MEKEYYAVMIRKVHNTQDRFYCDGDGRPLLWEFDPRPRELHKTLLANGITCSVVKVLVKTTQDPA